MTRIGDDFLGLLQCTQVEERDFEAGLIILDALEKRMTDGRNVALEGVAFYEELIALREVVLVDTLLYSFEKGCPSFSKTANEIHTSFKTS